MPGGGPDMMSIVVDILGMDPSSLKGEVEQGKSLGQIADAQGLDREVLTDRIQQSMLDAMQERMRQEIRRMLDRPFGRPPDKPVGQ
jgi:hypothetical protein